MKDRKILLLTKQLIAIPSITKERKRSLEVLSIARNALLDFPYTHFVSRNTHSFLFTNKAKRRKHFTIILNAHLDVVPGRDKQFTPIERGGKLYGRGAYDMKGAAAVMILLFKELANKLPYPLGLQIVTDEENGDVDGTKNQVAQGVRADFVVVGEGTNLRIVHAAKGMLILKLQASGKSSHGAYPWLGDNAFLKLQEAIIALYKKYPAAKNETYATTVNVASISTENKAYNKTPDLCEALIDIRYVDKEKDSIFQTLQSCLPNGVNYEIVHHLKSHNVSPDNEYIKRLHVGAAKIANKEILLASAHGTSDLPHFSEVGCNGVEFGPIGGNPHQDDEWVDIASLETYYQILKHFLLSSASNEGRSSTTKTTNL